MTRIAVKHHNQQEDLITKLLNRAFILETPYQQDKTLIYQVTSAPRNPNRLLPTINLEFVSNEATHSRFTPNDLRAMFMNPIYAGIGPYPPLIDDERFLAANVSMLRRDGPDQYLTNLLYLLRRSLGYITDKPIPSAIAPDAGIEFFPDTSLNIRLTDTDESALNQAEAALNTLFTLKRASNKQHAQHATS